MSAWYFPAAAQCFSLYFPFLPKSWHLELLSWKDCPAFDLIFGRESLPPLSQCKAVVLYHTLGSTMSSVYLPVWAPSRCSTDRLSVKIQPRFIPKVVYLSISSCSYLQLPPWRSWLDLKTLWMTWPESMCLGCACFSLKITLRLFYLSNLCLGKGI